jgi:hypothetical protein
MITILEIREKLVLEEAEVQKIQRCVSSYCKSSLIAHIAHLVFEAFWGLFGYSYWQISKSILQEKSLSLMNGDGKKATVFAEFLLRFLVMQEGETKGWAQYIHPHKWGPIRGKSWEEIVLRVPEGDGESLTGVNP